LIYTRNFKALEELLPSSARNHLILRISFARIGSGSLGGKARGLGFVNTLINIINPL